MTLCNLSAVNYLFQAIAFAFINGVGPAIYLTLLNNLIRVFLG